eukprot:15472297-Alexandrium_andersonii.AAC.1
MPRRLTLAATSVVYRSISCCVLLRGMGTSPAGACPGCSAVTGRLESSPRTLLSGSSSTAMAARPG